DERAELEERTVVEQVVDARAGVELPGVAVLAQPLLAAHRARSLASLGEVCENLVPAFGGLLGHQRPRKVGGRRSMYASNASRRSSVCTFTLCASVSISSACASESVDALSSSRFVDDSAIGGPAAIVSTSS